MTETICNDAEVKGKQEASRQEYVRLLDVLYKDLSKPYEDCNLRKWNNDSSADIPVPLSAQAMLEALKRGKGGRKFLERNGIPIYSLGSRFSLPLVEILEMLEAHPCGRESWPNGELVPEMREALRKLDELGDSEQFILVEGLGSSNKGLTLVSHPDPRPELGVLKYMPVRGVVGESNFEVRLVVPLAAREALEVGKDRIIPYFYGHISPSWGDEAHFIELVGYRFSDKTRDYVEDNEGRWGHYAVHTDPKEVWRRVRDATSRKMYAAIKEIVNKRGK